MPLWGIFGLELQNFLDIFPMEFKKNIVIFEISNIEFKILQKNKNAQIIG